MSRVVLAKILGVFFNTLPADGKYPVQYCENLQLPIQMQLPQKRKTFSAFFVPFVESTSSFKHSETKKMMVIANVFPKLQNVENRVRRLCKKRRFETRFDSQQAKVSQILAKSP